MAFKGADNKDAECYNEEYEVIPRKQQPEHDFVSGGGKVKCIQRR